MGRVTVTACVLRRGPCHADRHEQTSPSRVSVGLGLGTYAEPLYGRLSARGLIPVCDLVLVPVPVPVLVPVSGDGCGP
ncbi:hypothetical protein ACFY13_45210 [Streptomyces mirabilis]|uniref:hypothetical protein n=1 Tax=Streptomyces mirabilis TaxID=68239 RepID=UPI0036B49EB2